MKVNECSVLYVLIGISGAGKSTFSVKAQIPVVSTDAIREELFGTEESQKNPAQVFGIASDRVNKILKSGKDMIFDATNTTKRGRQQFLHSVHQDCRKVAVLFPVTLETALERNKNRKRVVPETVIRRQYAQLLRDGASIPKQFDEIIFVK